MSERPTTANPDASRSGRPKRRFRDLPIWTKLGTIMIVPTLATIAVGTTGLVGQVDTASAADRTRALAELSGATGELVHQLQDERVAAVRTLGADDDDDLAEKQSAYNDVQAAVDDAREGFEREREALVDAPDSIRELWDSIGGELDQLRQTRNQISGGEIGIITASSYYENLSLSLISLRNLVAQQPANAALADRMRAAVAVSRAKESLSQRRLVGHVVFIRGAYNPYLRTAYIGAQTGHEQSLQAFSVVATPEDQAVLDGIEGEETRSSEVFQGHLNSLDSGSLRTLPVDAEEWDDALSSHGDLLRGVEQELDTEVVADATALRDETWQDVLQTAAVLLGVLGVAVLIAWLVARSMAQSLRSLRHGALAVAQHGLPQAVARLRDPALSTQLSPDQVANQIAEPLPVRSRDEFGQVAEAFNAVHLEAVRTAAEQAALRSSVSTMFINLARRSQILVDRLIGQLDRMERREEDPDRLAELFQLDHLATRMRRNDENLLVLAGADSTRVQRQPAPLLDVLRAAQSEVEQYTRIELGVVDRDIEVAAHAVNDLVHLVAELLDNATVFSPPDSQVMVEARRVGDRAVLYVEDRGLGLSTEQLTEINARLASPPQVDVAVSRMMGLVVVARLAARHSVKVELRQALERGTVADVTLPSSVLVPRTQAGAPEAISGYPDGGSERPALEQRRSATGGAEWPQPGGTPGHPAAPAAAQPPPRHPAPPAGDSPSGHPPSFPPAPALPPAPGFSQPTSARGGSRSKPAWSDLIGTTGHNGFDIASNGSAPPPDNSGTPEAPGSPGGSARLDGPALPPLPRRGGDSAQEQPDSPASGGTGRSDDDFPGSAPGPAAQSGSVPGQSATPPDRDLPWLPPPDPTTSAGRSGSGYASGPLPRQRPTTPPAAPTTPPAADRNPPPPTAGSQPPAAASPPPWPPEPPAATGGPADTPPPTPAPGSGSGTAGGSTAGSAGGTGSGRPGATGAPVAPAPYTPPPPTQAPVGDHTVELPIFRELESVWFRTKRPAREETGGDDERRSAPTGVSESAASAPPAPAAAPSSPASPEANRPDLVGDAAVGDTGSGGETARREPTPEHRPQPTAADGWRTAADEGWRAASTAAETSVEELTAAGLPKRRPMAQLVPGGVERAQTDSAAQRRSPEAVRGLLSAYHRGVQRGRGQTTDDEMSGSGGSQSTPAGKEQK